MTKQLSDERLRALTTITDEMVELSAIQMCATDRQSSIWPILTEAEREEFRTDARAVLTAAFGGVTAHSDGTEPENTWLAAERAAAWEEGRTAGRSDTHDRPAPNPYMRRDQ